MKKKKMRKGQALLVSHALFVAFSIILVFVVAATFASLYLKFQDFTAANEVQQVCSIARGAVEKIYPATGFRSQTETLQGSINVNLPDRIGGMNYNMRFVNRSIDIEYANTAYLCSVGFSADYFGSSAGGLTQITLTRNLTADRIEMTSL